MFTWNVHAPEGNRLQPVDSKCITGIEETLNGTAEVLASGVDFAVGLPHEVVGEFQGLLGDFGAVADTLCVLTSGLKALLEDLNRGFEAAGILERSLPQES